MTKVAFKCYHTVAYMQLSLGRLWPQFLSSATMQCAVHVPIKTLKCFSKCTGLWRRYLYFLSCVKQTHPDKLAKNRCIWDVLCVNVTISRSKMTCSTMSKWAQNHDDEWRNQATELINPVGVIFSLKLSSVLLFKPRLSAEKHWNISALDIAEWIIKNQRFTRQEKVMCTSLWTSWGGHE